MSDLPQPPEDPFGGLPPELRQLFEQLGGTNLFQQLQPLLGQPATDDPVNWQLARQVAMQQAGDGDRPPTGEERRRLTEAQQVAEHWLDESKLPTSPDAGQVVVASRQDWIDAALRDMRPLIEPVARASTRAMAELASQQLRDVDLDSMGLGPLAGMLRGFGDFDQLMKPMGAMLSGLQAGQVIGQLSRQLLGQYELGLPTAPRSTAYHLAVNIEEVFGDWELDPTETAVALALAEGAYRRLYHAVPWLEAHLQGLVAQFANGTVVDAEQVQRLSQEMMLGVDPEDPESLQAALEKAGSFRLEPTHEQRRVLERLQGVVLLVQTWARREIERAAGTRLPNRSRIDEVLRRRRASKGDGEQLLEQLLGLDLKPDDESIGEAFIDAVERSHGPEGLRRALAHPENLPDTEELADPRRWLDRMAVGEDVPDDAAGLFEGLGEAPHERSAAERTADPDDGPPDGDEPSGSDEPPGAAPTG